MTVEPSLELDQSASVARLPHATLVDRVAHLRDRSRGRRVIHVGFADVAFRENQEATETWLHAHLAKTAATVVGIDVDPDAVARARADGYEVYMADCTEPAAVRTLGLEPADLVIAGEVIEHLGAPGRFLCGLRELCAPDGRLVITTPNAYGLLNVAASMAGYEINHPDHVVMFTWRTLTALLARSGWEPLTAHTYVPRVRPLDGAPRRAKLMAMGARAVLLAERGLARIGAPFAADGLIVEARLVRD